MTPARPTKDDSVAITTRLPKKLVDQIRRFVEKQRGEAGIGGNSDDRIQGVAQPSVEDEIDMSKPRQTSAVRMFRSKGRMNMHLVEIENIQAKQSLAAFSVGRCALYQSDCVRWLKQQAANSIHAVVTDPPMGLSSPRRASRKSFAVAAAVSGACRRRSMATVARRCPGLPSLAKRSLGSSRHFSRSGGARFFRSWCPARTW